MILLAGIAWAVLVKGANGPDYRRLVVGSTSGEKVKMVLDDDDHDKVLDALEEGLRGHLVGAGYVSVAPEGPTSSQGP